MWPCGKCSLMVSLLCILPFAAASGSGQTCPLAPNPPGDRRSQNARDAVTIAVYNVYWLFDGVNDPNPVPWDNAGLAADHIKKVAAMMAHVNADIWILTEVEDCDVLSTLRNEMGEVGKEYEYYLVQGTDTFTGQDVALFTRIDPVVPLERSDERTEYPMAGTQCGGSSTGTYGVSKHFVTEIQIAPDLRIAVAGLHFLAIPDDADRCRRREAQAETLRKAIAQRVAGRGDIAGVVVGGDFNDFSPSFADAGGRLAVSRAVEILKNAGTPALKEQSGRVGKTERYSYGTGRGSLLDHLLLSPSLDAMVTSATMHHVGPDGKEGYLSTAWKQNGGSDHWPFAVTITFSALGDTPQPTPRTSSSPARFGNAIWGLVLGVVLAFLMQRFR
eukprot:Hpha_TRINITY_DN8504_c0_g1::TRINITY_DN8504_c0_g1_i1::g.146632::m.146632